jgi:GNAT superfamily N-acetyltransferase
VIALINTMISIQRIELPLPGLDVLVKESLDEGFDFIERLVQEWESCVNCFDRPGEVLLGSYFDDILIAVGGLNIDPYTADPSIGRIRHFYVRSEWRNIGIGRQLLEALVEESRRTFRTVRLRAENAGAARLYERTVFVAISDPHASHIMSL